MHYSVKRGFKACVELLVQSGADLNIKNSEDNTALDVAIENEVCVYKSKI